jgi:hypothetical protein
MAPVLEMVADALRVLPLSLLPESSVPPPESFALASVVVPESVFELAPVVLESDEQAAV